MLHFLGSDLDLDVDETFERYDGPLLFAGHDFLGQGWLVMEVVRTVWKVSWLCAPQSQRALECVRSGQADVRDALRHSATGAVELVTLEKGQVIADRMLLCAQIGNDLLPLPGWHLSAA
jgi:hypothetical protein